MWQVPVLPQVSKRIDLKISLNLIVCRITALCSCTPEDKEGEPKNVLYGWCVKCRSKYPEDYSKVIGYIIISNFNFNKSKPNLLAGLSALTVELMWKTVTPHAE